MLAGLSLSVCLLCCFAPSSLDLIILTLPELDSTLMPNNNTETQDHRGQRDRKKWVCMDIPRGLVLTWFINYISMERKGRCNSSPRREITFGKLTLAACATKKSWETPGSARSQSLCLLAGRNWNQIDSADVRFSSVVEVVAVVVKSGDPISPVDTVSEHV